MYGILHSFFMNLKHLYFILLERARDHTGLAQAIARRRDQSSVGISHLSRPLPGHAVTGSWKRSRAGPLGWSLTQAE